jgi:ketopantoate reductase
MHFVVIGTGGIGGYYGARLQAMASRLHLLPGELTCRRCKPEGCASTIPNGGLTPMNPLSALTRLDTGTLMSEPGLSQIVYGLMTEATAAASADRAPLTETDCNEMFELMRHFDPIKTSMLVDFEHHRPLELEQICGAVLSRSRQLKREAPYTFTIYQLLRLAASRETGPQPPDLLRFAP